jgi:hypothetical protein
MQAAVITADIVNYTQLRNADQKKIIADLSAILKGNKFDFYRGDRFNVYVKNPAGALKLAVRLRVAARKYTQKTHSRETDIRISIGIGQVDAPVRSLRTTGGEAFTLSGRTLDAMASSNERLTIISNNNLLNLPLKIIAYFMDYLINQLTSKQADVLTELLNGRNQTQAADHLGKSQATINQHLKSAAWNEIERLLGEYITLMSKFK